MLDETERPIPNFDPHETPGSLHTGAIPFHLYYEWEPQDTSEEGPEQSDHADSMRSSVVAEVPEDQFLSSLGATVVHRNVSVWQALQIWRRNNWDK